MRKLLLSASALSVMALGSINVDAQVNKTPFVEHFTQASCGPCASQNPTMYATLNTFGSANYVKLTYQTSWPGVDPMNAQYPEGPQSRVTYYGVSGVPDATLNGGTNAAPNTAVTAITLANKATETTAYDITVSHVWNGGNIDVTVVVDNVTGASVSTMDRIYVAMVEDQVSYSSAPGTNGETDFYYVLRQFYDANNGDRINEGVALAAIAGNSNTTFNFTVDACDLPLNIKDINELNFVAFVQNDGSKVIDQAGKSTPIAVPAAMNVAAAKNNIVGAGYCDLSFTPQIDYTNNDAVTVTTVTAEYSLNGGTPVSQTFNGNLTTGQSTTIAFPAVSFVAGTNTVTYSICSPNGTGIPMATLAYDLMPDTYNKLAASGSAAPMAEGFEGGSAGTFTTDGTNGLFDDVNAAGLGGFSVIDGQAGGLTSPTGGNAASARSLMFRFYTLNGSEQMNWVTQKVNLTSTNSQLTFNHAYKQYVAENDRLEVMVSDDCGANWTTVFNEAGATLMTEPAASAQFYPQAAGEWDPNTVSLAAFDNTNDVIVMFRGTSAYGNNLFVDDINITSGGVSVYEHDFDANNVEIMPNPVNNKMTVNYTSKSDNATIEIRNLQGQLVMNVNDNTVVGDNTVAVNTSELPSGVYILSIISDVEATTKRFVVNR